MKTTLRHTPGRYLITAAMAATLATALSLSACGSDGGTSGTTSAPDAATGTPIVIGYANTEQGPQSIPQTSIGVQAAVTYINGHGGINGHVVELETCLNDGTPAASVDCANQFASKNVTAVLDGTDLGVDAMVPGLTGAGITVFGTLFQGVKASASPGFFQIAPSFVSTYTIGLKALADQGVKKFALISISGNQSATQLYETVVKPAAEQLGVTPTMVTYNPASPNFTSVVATLRADDADGAFFVGNDELCNGFAQAAATARFTENVLMGTCTDFITRLGGRAEGFQTIQTFYPPAVVESDQPKEVAADLEQYADSLEASDSSDAASSTFALWGYASMIDLARILATIPGEVTPQSATEAISSTTDLQGFDGDVLDCTGLESADGAACTKGLLVLTTNGDGKLELVGDGYTLAPGTEG